MRIKYHYSAQNKLNNLTNKCSMVKLRKNVTIDNELVEWVDSEIKKKRFASLSHAIEYALQKLKDEKEI